MTSITAVPATPVKTDLAVNVKTWAKPVEHPTADAGEAGVRTRLDVGPLTLENKLVAYGQVSADKVLVKGIASGAVEAGPVALDGRTRGTVIVEDTKVTVDGRVNGAAAVGAASAEGVATGRASVGINGARVSGAVAGSVDAVVAQVAGAAEGVAGIEPGVLHAAGSANATANVGSAGVGGAVSGAAKLSLTEGLKVDASASADAKLGGYAVTLAAKGSVKVDSSFPFIHIDASVDAGISKPAKG